MNEQVSFALRGRNPDVLTCIANLSNDEVFTPPEFANRMLDTLAEAWAERHDGANIWSDSSVRFLDPFTKSGVFLREISTRLIAGLKDEIPDLQERVDHILTKQIFGIGITRLTSLLARRSLYCSKHANGEHSVTDSFQGESGNIWFERTEHSWAGGKCIYCGATKQVLDRGDDKETHAYAFIHAADIKSRIREMFGDEMQFDVIIGNPPYQLATEGFGTQARPIYPNFVQQAKNLEPRLLSMVMPARWFSGGMGLDEFRSEMLNDQRLRIIHDFPDSNDVFPGTQIKGGICYILWDRDNPGLVSVTTHDHGIEGKPVERPLLESGLEVFIRYNDALPILKKVFAVENGMDIGSLTSSFKLPVDRQLIRLVSSIGAFGLDTTFRGKSIREGNDVKVYRNGGIGFIDRSELTKELNIIDSWKVFVPAAGSGSDSFPHSIIGKPFVGEPGSASSWTYNYIGPFESEEAAKSAVSYLSCRLTRFLILLHKPSQHTNRKVYTFVPTQKWESIWTDSDLYKKYGLADNEIAFIESMIRPMELGLA